MTISGCRKMTHLQSVVAKNYSTEFHNLEKTDYKIMEQNIFFRLFFLFPEKRFRSLFLMSIAVTAL